MSRLYVWVENDKGTQRTLEGNTSLTATINYGSKKDSKLAVSVLVEYPDGADIPKISVMTPFELAIEKPLAK